MTLIRPAWSDYRRQHPGLRIRDAAARLGVSEVELLASDVNSDIGGGVTRLEPRFADLLPALARLGTVKTITRNNHAVLERVGAYGPFDLGPRGGLALGDIDLRIFLGPWRSLFAVEEEGREVRRSLQIFDEHGTAVHKVYLTGSSRADVFAELVREYRHGDQTPGEAVHPAPPPARELPDDAIDAAALRAAWDDLADTHQFTALLGRFAVTRTQALRLAGDGRARPVPAAALRALLSGVAEAGTAIMIFVGNRGMLQIYTGPVGAPVITGPWLNLLDPTVNLHLREDAIASAWVVRKPTRDGVVSSLEVFDADGETIALLFGRRKPGQAEAPAWRAHLAALAPAAALADGVAS